jgi:hypothetical protein
MQGMAFGGGSAVAHRAVDAVAGPRTMQVEHVGNEGQTQAQAGQAQAQGVGAHSAPAQAPACNQYQTQFTACMQENHSDIQQCQVYFDMFRDCQANQQFAQ